jgi:hypothetical protein
LKSASFFYEKKKKCPELKGIDSGYRDDWGYTGDTHNYSWAQLSLFVRIVVKQDLN